MQKLTHAVAAWTLLAAVHGAGAQPTLTVNEPPPAAAPAPAVYTPPTWPTPEIEKLAGLLTGSWKTSAPVAEQGSTATIDVWMHVKPIAVKGLTGTLYVEQARADAPERPYRQAFFQLYPYKDKVRLRTLEFRSPSTTGMMTGLWQVPQYFPTVEAGELIATIDIELTRSPSGYSGRTPYPYPTNLYGAVEMTSEISISPDTLVVQDRGYDATGKVVWGSGAGDSYTFKKTSAPYKADVRDNGLIVIPLRTGAGDLKVAEGNRVGVHYTGWLTSGRQFESSRPNNRPLLYNHPRGVVAGWSQSLEGATKGEVRKVIIPHELGYGVNGTPKIPPYATIIFETEIVSIDVLPKAPSAPAAPQGDQPQPK